ncbi:hypothetical protein AB4084_40035, partial [Lysobacter sp. 2RAB21]
VYGRLMPARASRQVRALPIGLAHHVKLTRDVAAGRVVTSDDVALDETQAIVSLRRELEATEW